MRRLWRHRDFRLLYAGQALSAFGDYALLLALGVWAKDLTGSSSAAGAVFLAFVLPALAAPAFGLVVDRFPRRRVMVVTDVVMVVVVLALFTVDDASDLWVIYGVSLLYGASAQVFAAARTALLTTMLPSEQHGDANGLLESTRQGVRLGAPLVGAALYAAFGGAAVAALDAATFAVSAVVLAMLRVDEPARVRSSERLRAQLAAGARHIARTLEVRRAIVATAAALAFAGLSEVALFALVDEGLGRPPEFVGVLGAVQGAGSVAGGLLAGPLTRRIGDSRLLGIGLVGFGLGLAIEAIATLPAALTGVAVAGAGVSAATVAYVTLLQRRTDEALQGRVFLAGDAFITVGYAISIALGVWLVAVVDYRLLLLVAAAGLTLGAAGLLRRRDEAQVG